MTDWRSHWEKLESSLRALLEGFPSLPTEQRGSVLHYIDHNEFGLAFEELCSCIQQGRLPISSAQYETLVDLQTMMKMREIAETVRDLIVR